MANVQITIYVSPELAAELNNHKQNSDLTRNQIINRILKRYYLYRRKNKEAQRQIAN